jgi:hypothetical protein
VSGLDPTGLHRKAAQIALDTLKAMKDAIDATSPSKLAAQLVGEPIVQGIIVGMEAEETKLKDAAGKIAKDSLKAMADGIGDEAGKVGKAIMDGIADGAEAAEPAVSRRFGALRRGIYTSWQEAEPSFADLGTWTLTEIGKGLEHTELLLTPLGVVSQALIDHWVTNLTPEALGLGEDWMYTLGKGIEQGTPQTIHDATVATYALLHAVKFGFDPAQLGEIGRVGMHALGQGFVQAGPKTEHDIYTAAYAAMHAAKFGFDVMTPELVDAAKNISDAAGSNFAGGLKRHMDEAVAHTRHAVSEIVTAWANASAPDFWGAVPQPGSGGYSGGAVPGQGQYTPPVTTVSPGMPKQTDFPQFPWGSGSPGGFTGYNPISAPVGLPNFQIDFYSAIVTGLHAANPGMTIFGGNMQHLNDAAASLFAGNPNVSPIDAAAGYLVGGNVPFNFQIVPNVNAFAEGGIVTRPMLGLVGERGPEAIIPLPRAGSAPVEIHNHITIQGPIFGLDELDRKVAESVTRTARRGGFTGVFR